MKKLTFTFLFVLGLTIPSAFAQTIQAPGGVNFGNGVVVKETSGNGIPASSCSGITRYTQLDATAGSNIWTCINGTMVQQLGGSGSGSACDAGSPTGQCNINKQVNVPAVQAGSAITGNSATITNLSTIPSNWTLDVTSPATAYASLNGPGASQWLDVRNFSFAGGAVCDGAHDISPAINAAIASQPSYAAVNVWIPNGCTLQHPELINWGSHAGAIVLHVQGIWSLGSTLTVPYNKAISVIGEGGSYGAQFSSPPDRAQIVVDANAKGTLGTAVSVTLSDTINGDFGVTQTFTPSTMEGLVVGAAISVSQTLTCNISSITRGADGYTVTATLSGACHIPPGVQVKTTGVTDSTFNGSHTSNNSGGEFLVIASDYVANTVTWKQASPGTANATSSGGTLVGFDEDTPEVVQISAVTSTTATAKFYRSHPSTARWALVGLYVGYQSGQPTMLKNLTISSPGVGLYLDGYESRVENVDIGNFNSCGSSDPTQSYYGYPVESWSGFSHMSYDSFQATCVPWSIHFAMPFWWQVGQDGPHWINNSFLKPGIKLDHGGYSTFISNTVCEICARALVSYDPTHYWNGNSQNITIDHALMQDNPYGYNPILVYQTVPIASSSATATVTLDSATSGQYGTMNNYFTGKSVGSIVDQEVVGEGAGLGPSIAPYATESVPSSGWNQGYCSTTTSTALAPDGSSTATYVIHGSGNYYYIWDSQWAKHYTPVVGDRILFGGWESGGTYGGFYLDNGGTGPYHFNFNNLGTTGAYQTFSTAQWDSFTASWHVAVGEATVTYADGTTNAELRLLVDCSSSSVSKGYWSPFIIIIPASANVPASEVDRWREMLLHGAVAPGVAQGTLGMIASHKLNWGGDTNLYRASAGVLQTDNTFVATGGVDIQASSLNQELPNNTASGATLNKLVCAASVGGVAKAQTCTTTSTNWSGVAVGGATGTTSGNTILASKGTASCIFDGTTIFGDYVQISSTVAGDCHDSGATSYPTSGAVIGRVRSVNTGAGTAATVDLYSPGIMAGGGGGGTGSSVYTVVTPSGDTTGATDGAAITTACTTGAAIQLIAGTYYVGASNATGITMSNPCTIVGLGPQTIIDNKGTTNTVVAVTYANTGNANTAGRLSNLSILQDSGVTPTGGTGIAIGTGSGSTYTYYFKLDHVFLMNLWRGVTVNTGEEVIMTDTVIYYSNVSGGGGCVYYAAASPSGGNHLNKINCGGSNSQVTITQSDTTSWSDLSISQGQLVFTQAGPTINISFTNLVAEDSNMAHTSAVDCGTGTNQPARITFTGGRINQATQAFSHCGTVFQPVGISVDNMTFNNVSTIDGLTAASTAKAYNWGSQNFNYLSQIVSQQDLVAWWPCNEGGTSATTCVDRSGNGNNLTLNGTKSCGSGSYYTTKGYILFNAWCGDGSTNYGDAGNSSVMNPANQITLSLWFALPSNSCTNDEIFLSRDDNTLGRSYSIMYSNQTGCSFVFFANGSTLLLKYTTTPVANTWHHLCVSGNSNNGINLYYDGVSQAYAAWTNLNATTGSTQVGARSYATSRDFANANLEDIRIYGSQQSCPAIYSAGPQLR